MTLKVLLVRSIPLGRDSRSSKMVAAYRQRGHSVTPVIWSRGEHMGPDRDVIGYTARGEYGRRFRGLFARFGWMMFLAGWMLRNRTAYDVVHVVDLDTGIVAVPIARWLGYPIIYDAFDHIGAIAGGGRLASLLAKVERWAMAQADIVIFPDAIRLEQYGVEPSDRIRIIGNIPDLQAIPTAASANDGPLQLVYIGTLEAEHRGLEYLPAVCSDFRNSLHITVGGTGALDSYFLQAAARCANLTYIGQQDYDAALRKMLEADCLYGPYLLSAPAHRYASPNKVYEHLALGKPLMTNTGTPPGMLVERLGSGFLFDGSIDGLRSLLARIDRATCRGAGSRAAAAWQAEYSGLRAAQLEAFFQAFSMIHAATR